MTSPLPAIEPLLFVPEPEPRQIPRRTLIKKTKYSCSYSSQFKRKLLEDRVRRAERIVSRASHL